MTKREEGKVVGCAMGYPADGDPDQKVRDYATLLFVNVHGKVGEQCNNFRCYDSWDKFILAWVQRKRQGRIFKQTARTHSHSNTQRAPGHEFSTTRWRWVELDPASHCSSRLGWVGVLVRWIRAAG